MNLSLLRLHIRTHKSLFHILIYFLASMAWVSPAEAVVMVTECTVTQESTDPCGESGGTHAVATPTSPWPANHMLCRPHTHTSGHFWSISGLSARPEGCWDRAGQIHGIISTHLQYQDWFLYHGPANLWFTSLKPGTKITTENWPTKCLTAIPGTSKPHLRERCRSTD